MTWIAAMNMFQLDKVASAASMLLVGGEGLDRLTLTEVKMADARSHGEELLVVSPFVLLIIIFNPTVFFLAFANFFF